MSRATARCSTSSMVRSRFSRSSIRIKAISPREFITILGSRMASSNAAAAAKGLDSSRISPHWTSSATRVRNTRSLVRRDRLVNHRKPRAPITPKQKVPMPQAREVKPAGL